MDGSSTASVSKLEHADHLYYRRNLPRLEACYLFCHQIQFIMKLATALLLGISLASAQEVYQPTVGRGPIPQSRFNGSDFDALSTPNASTSVNFTVGGQEWTWRVNITDFSVPSASIEGKPAPDARVIMATYDLQWLFNGSLSEAAADLNEQSTHASSQSAHGPQTPSNASGIEDPICMSVLDDAIVWPNVTNKYESGSSSCDDIFGQDCMRAILMHQTYSADGGCRSPSLNIDACEGVFDTTGSYTQSASCKPYYYNYYSSTLCVQLMISLSSQQSHQVQVTAPTKPTPVTSYTTNTAPPARNPTPPPSAKQKADYA
jgi:hypothetical protein